MSTRPCGLCGSAGVDLVRSRTEGSLLERALGKVDPDERTTAVCRSCGARMPIPQQWAEQPARSRSRAS